MVVHFRIPYSLSELAAGPAFAPNGHEPRLLVAREPRWAEVTLHLEEPGSGDVIAPGVEIEETAVAVIA